MATRTHTRSRMPALLELGQSIWLDYLRRGMIRSGELAGLIDAGLRGMTSNPTIFEQGIAEDDDYDEALARLATSGRTDAEIFEALAVEDVRSAADLFRPVYDQTNGGDGFVSIEVSPGLARDTRGSVAEAERLWRAVDRPNVMIKIPGTAEGWPAIEQCLDRRHQHQHHVAVLGRALPEGGRGVPGGAGSPPREGRADRPGGIGRLVLREPGGHRGGCPARQDRPAGGEGAGRHHRHRQRPPRLRGVRADQGERPLAPAGGEGRQGAAAALGQHRHQEPGLLRRALPRRADRPRHHQHRPARHAAPVRRPRTVAPTLAGHEADARERMERLDRLGVDFDDVTGVLEDEGIEKFAKSYAALLAAIGRKR